MSSPAYIEISKDDLSRLTTDFALMNSEVPAASARVINRTITAINTEASSQVQKYYNLTATRVKKNFSVTKATKNNLSARWASIGEPVSLINFGAKQKTKGVSVKVLKSSSRTIVYGTFIQVGNNNNKHVFWREMVNGVRVARYDIHKLDGPRIEDALAKAEVQTALQAKADSTIQTRIDAEANYILSKAK
jgi:hypothetical protein